MNRFMLGALAGGLVVWLWKDRVLEMLDEMTRQARDRAANGLGKVQATAESTMDAAKEQISSGLRAGQDYIRRGE
jgi:hypothetical protein